MIKMIKMIKMINKYHIFKIIHDYPIEVYILWFVFACFIIVFLLHIYFRLTDYSETYQFIMNL